VLSLGSSQWALRIGKPNVKTKHSKKNDMQLFTKPIIFFILSNSPLKTINYIPS